MGIRDLSFTFIIFPLLTVGTKSTGGSRKNSPGEWDNLSAHFEHKMLEQLSGRSNLWHTEHAHKKWW